MYIESNIIRHSDILSPVKCSLSNESIKFTTIDSSAKSSVLGGVAGIAFFAKSNQVPENCVLESTSMGIDLRKFILAIKYC